MKYYGIIDYELLFSTYKEYRLKKKLIIDKVNEMSVKEKVIYRMYIYSRPLVSERQKDYIWEEMVSFLKPKKE